MSISLRSLEYFVVCAETGSIREAADKMYRSYQSVYHGIIELEKELGHALFLRSAGELKLTDYGNDVLHIYVLPILRRVKMLRNSRDAYAKQEEMNLSVELDCQQIKYADVGMAVAKTLKERYPEAEIHCDLGDPEEILDHLRNGETDLILRLNTSRCWGVEVCLNAVSEIFLFVSPAHSLADRASVTVDDVRNETFLFFSPYGYKLMTFWQLTGLSPVQAAVMDMDNPITKQLFDAGEIIRVLSADNPQGKQGELLSNAVRIPFDPPLFENLGIMKLPDAKWKRLMTEYVKMFQTMYQEKFGRVCMR